MYAYENVACRCVCALCFWESMYRAKKRVSEIMKWLLIMVMCHHVMLGTEHVSLGRIVNTLNHQTCFLVLHRYFKFYSAAKSEPEFMIYQFLIIASFTVSSLIWVKFQISLLLRTLFSPIFWVNPLVFCAELWLTYYFIQFPPK